MTLDISSGFPTGNGTFRQLDTHEFVIDRDLRDSTGERWYWHLRLQADREITARVHLGRPRLIGQFGPAVMSSGAPNWLYAAPGPDTVFEIPLPRRTPVSLCATMPYGPRELKHFRAGLGTRASWRSLAVSEGGREVPLLIVPQPDAENLVLLTARHHACEAMASYVLEGAVREFIRMQQVRNSLAARCELVAAPIMDVDGVARGDQGKARNPWDHNRDYGALSRYSSVAGLRKFLAADNRQTFALDLHTPGLRGPIEELPYIVASGDSGDHDTAERFLTHLKSSTAGREIGSPGILDFDHDWNSSDSISQRCCSAWLRSRKNTRIALTIEYPNAVDQGSPVTPSRARNFGARLMQTLITET